MKQSNTVHFLYRPRTIRLLWWIFSGVLALTLLAQLAFHVKGYFTIDGWFGFGAVYGLLSCLVMVLFAKALGMVLKRPRNYHSEREDDV
jgi:uncharacterized membrane protein